MDDSKYLHISMFLSFLFEYDLHVVWWAYKMSLKNEPQKLAQKMSLQIGRTKWALKMRQQTEPTKLAYK